MRLTQLIASSWRDSTPALRTVTSVALPVGAFVGVAGVVLDVTDAWASYSFVVNLASSIVGASFGIPIALVLLSSISREHAEALKEKETAELKGRAAGELSAACRRLFSEEFNLDCVAEVISELHRLADDCQGLLSSQDEISTVDKIHAVEAVKARLLNTYETVTGNADLRYSASEIKSRWTFLLVAVKARVYETGGEWLDYRAEDWFQRCLDEIDSILFEQMDADVRAAVPQDAGEADARLTDLKKAALVGADLALRVGNLIEAAAKIESSARSGRLRRESAN